METDKISKPMSSKHLHSLSASKKDVEVYAFFSGYLKTETQHLLENTRVGVPMTVPVPFFLIRHGRSSVIFDTGNNIGAARDPVGYWGADFVSHFTPIMGEEDVLEAQINKVGITADDISYVILSHGHRDHAGAIDTFRGTNIPVVMQREEVAEIREALSGNKRGFFVGSFRHIEELNIQPVEGIFDVFGDQTVVAFPARGHTIGCQSLMVRKSDGKTVILASDAVYTLESLAKAIPPPAAWDQSRAIETLHVMKIMKHIGAEIVPSHDPEYWKGKPLAPDPFEF